MDRRIALRRMITAFAALALAALAPSCIAPEAAHCDQMDTCGACTAAGSGCGWCNGSCMEGTSLGPTAGSCSSWAFDRCEGTPSPVSSTQVDSGAFVPTTPGYDAAVPVDPGEDASGFEDATSLDCGSFADCVSCAAAGCAYCGDFGTCEPIDDAINSCSSEPLTSVGSCN